MRCIRCIDLQLGHGGLPIRRATGDTFLSHQSQGKTVVTPPTRAQPGPTRPKEQIWCGRRVSARTRTRRGSTWTPPPRGSCIACPGHGYSMATAYRLLDCKTLKTWWPGPKPKQDLFSGLGTIHDSSIFSLCASCLRSMSPDRRPWCRTALFLWWLGMSRVVPQDCSRLCRRAQCRNMSVLFIIVETFFWSASDRTFSSYLKMRRKSIQWKASGRPTSNGPRQHVRLASLAIMLVHAWFQLKHAGVDDDQLVIAKRC